MPVFSQNNDALAEASTALADAGVALALTFDRLQDEEDPDAEALGALSTILRHVAVAGFLTDALIGALDGVVPDHSAHFAAVSGS